MNIIYQLLLLTIGFIMLVKGADWFVEGASEVASKFGIPQLVVGLTIVAMGTSAPEAAVSITAALKGNADITIGNIVGSNILNVLLILGITSVITAVSVKKSTIMVEIPYMAAVTVILMLMGMSGETVDKIEGGVLLAGFVIYLTYLFIMSKNDKEETEEIKSKDVNLFIMIISVLAGLAFIILGSNFAVDAASEIALIAGLSERFIGLTIVALGTSLPELFTSVSAALKGKADIAIGNIVGSNIFNILFIVGITASIIPVPFDAKFITDSIIAILAAAVLWICVIRKNRLNRAGGIIMLLIYAGYFIYLLR